MTVMFGWGSDYLLELTSLLSLVYYFSMTFYLSRKSLLNFYYCLILYAINYSFIYLHRS